MDATFHNKILYIALVMIKTIIKGKNNIFESSYSNLFIMFE